MFYTIHGVHKNIEKFGLWSQPRLVLFKNKTKIGNNKWGSFLTCIMMWRFYIAHVSLCSAYFCFKTKIGTMHFDGSHVTIFGTKKLVFLDPFFV